MLESVVERYLRTEVTMKYVTLFSSILAVLLIAGARGEAVQQVQPNIDLGVTGRFEFRVTRVEPGSPADAAGLNPGEVVRQLANRIIQSPEDLKRFGMSHVPGEFVEIRYERSTILRSSDGPRRLRATVQLRSPVR